ncbi:MAG: HD domain-containing protein, partial [Acidimicrobiales bacterium]
GAASLYDSDPGASVFSLGVAPADRIFRMLPEDQAAWMRGLWEEFEAKSSADARFAGALDRLQPLLMNSASAGGGWAAHGVTADRVRELNSVISLGSDALWSAASQIIDAAVAGGVLAASAGVTAPPGQPPPGQPTGDPD